MHNVDSPKIICILYRLLSLFLPNMSNIYFEYEENLMRACDMLTTSDMIIRNASSEPGFNL